MRPTFINVKTQQIDNENYVLITQEEYNKLRQSKDNKIKDLEVELQQACIELETYKTFFKNLKFLLDK